jgi:Periplasmic copper-binding protein (NosD)/Right handed beta helix region/Secretion system C-terminal sorting domain
MKKAIYLLFLFYPFLCFAQSLFTEPKMTFIQKPTEVISDMSFSSGTPIATIQSAIDAKRLAFPTNIIRITISGTFTVTTLPIQLSDRMLLILKNATIIAASNTTATSLISVNNGHYVTIASVGTSLLDGNNQFVTGVYVTTSGKTHIDKMTIQNCKSGGIYYTGAGAAVYADAGSATRCTITNCTAFGIYYIDSFNFICTDNTIQTSNTGISVNSNNSAVANNNITGCPTGIYISGISDAVTYNSVQNCTSAISIFNSASAALVAYNIIKNNVTALNLTCGKAMIYKNTLLSNSTAISGSGANTTQLYCNSGLSSTDATGKSCIYFNPPLIGNQHTDLIKIGKNRVDITITSGSMTSIRTALNNAHTANPTAVVVCHLNGNFYTTAASDSLLVKEDECILLNGTIANGSSQTQSVIYFKDSGINSSFSGGTIDGKKLNGYSALVYITGSANVVLDSIIVKNSLGQGISKKSSTSPTIIRGCFVDSCMSRNIWQLASSRLYAFSNISTNAQSDGLDLDAFSTYSVIMNNIFNNNPRDGIFIEEGANSHIVMDNTINYNTGPGISTYNMAVANLHTSKCLIANNTCTGNSRGIHLNALSLDRSTSDNVIFNNICNNNTDVGIGGLYSATATENNYIAFNSMQNNVNGPFKSTRDFVSNTDWNLLYPADITTNNDIRAASFSVKLLGNISALNTFKVQIEGTDTLYNLTLKDMQGKTIRLMKVSNGNNSISVENLASGIYILEISNRKSTITMKTMKP